MYITILNTNKKGVIVGERIVEDQFGTKFKLKVVNVLFHLGNKKTGLKDKKVNYIQFVNPYFINNCEV